MIGNPNETYYRYLARSRAGRSQRVGVPEWEPKREDGKVRCIPRCEGREGAGGTRKALEGIAALALVLFLLIPGVAYASVASDQYGEPVYGPVTYDWQGETWTSVAYIAANKFDAAAYACGYSKSEIGNWDLTVRAKLSNESTAPEFYELASGFYAPVADDFVYTDQGPAPGFWGWAYSIYGEGNIWYHDGYTDSLLSSARDEIETILDGGSVGGGTGVGGITQDGNYIELHVPKLNAVWGYDLDMFVLRIKKGTSMYNAIVNTNRDNSVVSVCVHPTANNSSNMNVSVYVTPKTVDIGVLENGSNKYVGVNLNRVSTAINTYYTSPVSYSSGGDYNATVTSTGNERLTADQCVIFTGDGMAAASSFNSLIGAYGSKLYVDWAWVDIPADGINTVPDPEPPENNWPDNDTPTVPEPPNSDAPSGGGNYVAPTLPKPTSPTQPVGVSVTVATPVDDILDALNKIIQELENHCVHLQNKMVECSTYLGAIQEQTRDAVIDAINEGMSNDVALHDELMSYLQELFQWMKDNMNYNVEVTNTINNDDVIDWLKRIYIQDGTGYSNSRPIDITQDYNGFGVWVDSLLDYVLPDLTDTNLAPVTSAFDALDDKFPFSVPGDVLRIFQSLDRSPVTPVVAVTIPSVLGIPAYTYSFDLSPYDTTMQTIRTIELMAFVVFLLVWARRAFNTEAGGASD